MSENTGGEAAVLSQSLPSNLRAKVNQGVIWSVGLNMFRDVLQFFVMLVMVRLLDPKAYGEFGLVNSILGLSTVLSFRPFLEQMLQQRNLARGEEQFYFTIGAIVQPAVFLGYNVLAIVLRWFPDYAEVAPLLHLASVLLLLEWFSEFRTRVLEWSLDWQRLRLLQAAGLLITAFTGLGLALRGWGVYALVGQLLTLPLPFVFDLLWVQRWRPTWFWNRAELSTVRQYGLSRIAVGVLTLGRPMVESTVLVHMIGYSGFGIFGRAVGLATLACTRLPTVLLQSVYPILTKLERDTDTFRRANSLVLRVMTWAVLPIAALLSFIGGPVVKILYGDKWVAAIPLLPWTLAAGSAAAIVQTVNLLLLANRQQTRCIVSEVAVSIGTGLGLLLLAPHGVVTYLAGISVAQAVAVALSLLWLYRGKAITPRAIWQALVPPLVASAVALAVCVPARQWLIVSGLKGWRDLVAPAAIGLIFGITYLLTVRVAFGRMLRELVDIVPFRGTLHKVLLYTGA